jgi:hypothetical protein
VPSAEIDPIGKEIRSVFGVRVAAGAALPLPQAERSGIATAVRTTATAFLRTVGA